MLYVKLQKSLFELMYSANLFYLKLATDWEKYGFTINQYYLCMSNKLVKWEIMKVL